jgi:hypothetical protein
MFAKPTITDLGTIAARTLDSNVQGSLELHAKTAGLSDVRTDAQKPGTVGSLT